MSQRLSPGTRRKNININMTYGCNINPNTIKYQRDDTIPGGMRFKGIILGRGWENWPLDYTKLSCYRQKGEEGMKIKQEAPENEVLLALWMKHGAINPIAKKYKASWATARIWLLEAGIIDKNNQTQTPPEPDQAANQEPAQDNGESAETIISISTPTMEKLKQAYNGMAGVTPMAMGIGCELPPERVSYTSSQYQDAIRPEDVDMDEIEPEPWETGILARGMIESWILDVYRLDINKRLKKRLIGQLLEIEVAW